MNDEEKNTHPQLLRLVEIIRRLRAPGGCPWDRKQTLESLTPHLLEEGYELIEAIEAKGDRERCEEAGDLLMVVVMICQVAADEGRFDLEQAARGIGDKLERRHPHIFGDRQVAGADEVVRNWEEIKRRERREKQSDPSPFAGVPRHLPACLRALRMGQKASLAGFDWPDARGALAKVKEELAELEGEMGGGGERGALLHELGDLLFAVANLGRLLGINPEKALRAALDRFDRRYRQMERELGKPPAQAESADELDAAWERAKAALRRVEGEGDPA